MLIMWRKGCDFSVCLIRLIVRQLMEKEITFPCGHIRLRFLKMLKQCDLNIKVTIMKWFTIWQKKKVTSLKGFGHLVILDISLSFCWNAVLALWHRTSDSWHLYLHFSVWTLQIICSIKMISFLISNVAWLHAQLLILCVCVLPGGVNVCRPLLRNYWLFISFCYWLPALNRALGIVWFTNYELLKWGNAAITVDSAYTESSVFVLKGAFVWFNMRFLELHVFFIQMKCVNIHLYNGPDKRLTWLNEQQLPFKA